MSEFKGTPGPWEYRSQQGERYIRNIDGVIMRSNSPYSQSIHACDLDWHLIASAPELLNCLVKMANEMGVLGYNVIEAREIIAKALGEKGEHPWANI